MRYFENMAQYVRSPDPVGRRQGAGRKRILIVDDNDSLLNTLRICLESHGFTVCGEALNGFDAIGKAVDTEPDLVILDLAMPDMNGVAVASTLQRLRPNVPIILLTIYGDHVSTSFASIFGIKAIVSKSDGMGKLIEAVQSLIKD
jgi:DNA-binding NarL/FixJ family response regulator